MLRWLSAYWAAIQPVTPVSVATGLGLPALFLLAIGDTIVTHLRQRNQ